MRRVLFILLIAAFIAPVALADTPATTADTSPAAAAPAETEAPAEADLETLLRDLDPLQDAESKYLCVTGCTTDWDCQMNEDPAYCNYERMCDNPTGKACAGTCFCC